MSRVFLVEPARRDVDVSSASTFGEIVTIFEPVRRGHGARVDGAPAGRAFPSAFDSEAYARSFLEELDARHFDPLTDYFMITGGMLAVSVAMASLCARYGSVQLLVFNTTMGHYVAKSFDVQAVTKGDTRWHGTGTSSLTPALRVAAR